MNRVRTAALSLVVAATVAPALAGGSAYAVDRPHVRSHTDAAHDVGRSVRDSSDHETVTPAPRRTDGDVLSSTVRHRARSVQVELRLASLRRSGLAVGESLRIVTDQGVRRDVTVQLVPGTGRTTVYVEGRDGQDRPCPGITARMDFARATTSVTVPRSCLGRPDWVRVGVGAFKQTGENTYYFDDAAVKSGQGDHLVLGPRVFH